MAYKLEFETRTAIPTLQNSFDSRIKLKMGGGEGEEENQLKLGGLGSTWRHLPRIKVFLNNTVQARFLPAVNKSAYSSSIVNTP